MNNMGPYCKEVVTWKYVNNVRATRECETRHKYPAIIARTPRNERRRHFERQVIQIGIDASIQVRLLRRLDRNSPCIMWHKYSVRERCGRAMYSNTLARVKGTAVKRSQRQCAYLSSSLIRQAADPTTMYHGPIATGPTPEVCEIC